MGEFKSGSWGGVRSRKADGGGGGTGRGSRPRWLCGLLIAVSAALVPLLMSSPSAAYFDRLWPGLFGLGQTDPSARLVKLEDDLERRFAEIGHLDSGTLASQLAARPEMAAEVVIFDVREPAEFEVSHIPGAIQVDPGLSAQAFLSRFKSVLDGAATGREGPPQIVFYCSVGVRSSKLASRVHEAGGAAFQGRVHNLRGGIFRWHNERRDLAGGDGGAETVVHGYDAYWSRFLKRRDQVIF